ncbi:helix-turn-helix transcriptional regulator [Streptomyces sp. P9(2023)]|uniref:helix-turn-helix transcriptional regulator n=1 Tax=Streptomyces sp. P9(2023) TaxID=3064394 RepID=UPI0037DDD038
MSGSGDGVELGLSGCPAVRGLSSGLRRGGDLVAGPRRPRYGDRADGRFDCLSPAVAGHRNAEIAAALHLARRTVETHLAQVYRKLAVRGRLQRAAALAEE